MAWKSRAYFISLASDAGAIKLSAEYSEWEENWSSKYQANREKQNYEECWHWDPAFFKVLSSVGTEGTLGGKFCVEWLCSGMIWLLLR